jgi:uncharacterized membrane protein YtjA (UPF0391 family)
VFEGYSSQSPAPQQRSLEYQQEIRVFRWAVLFLILSLIAGGLGLTNISQFAKRISMILFGLFFLGFLALLGFAYLVSSAISSSGLAPALVAISA